MANYRTCKSADMLSYAPGFRFNNARFSKAVEQRCFTMINMTHDSNDGGTLMTFFTRW